MEIDFNKMSKEEAGAVIDALLDICEPTVPSIESICASIEDAMRDADGTRILMRLAAHYAVGRLRRGNGDMVYTMTDGTEVTFAARAAVIDSPPPVEIQRRRSQQDQA